MNSSRLKNIEPILKVTKHIIKKSDKFNDYYIHKSNTLYDKQLPLLKINSKRKEVMALKLIKRNNNVFSEEKNYKSIGGGGLINSSYLLYANIRKQNIRSKKIPRLCPFYSKSGDLLPKVVSTSKISSNTFLTESNYDLNFSSLNNFNKIPTKRPLYAMSPLNFGKKNYSDYFKILEINFDEFQKEILYEEQYDNLKYENSKIFGHKELYLDYINELVKEIFISTNDENKRIIYEEGETKKEKIFDWGKNKVKIKLNLRSINVKIKEIINNNININKANNNELEDNNSFEYNLPINLLPLFYYKSFDKFKIFLLSFISFDEITQKFEVNPNISKIINNLLSNCSDLEVKKIIDKTLKEDTLNIVEPIIMKKHSAISKLTQNQLTKKSSKNYSTIKTVKSMNYDQVIPKNQIFASTNVNIISKKNYKKEKYDIYPKEKKKNDFLNYSIFNFLWNISDKIYVVSVEMPLITFEIPDFNIMVKQYINFELLFYLFKIKFKVWDFYIVKYLSSFKIFRILFSQLLSTRPKKNVCFYLEKYKMKNFENTDYKAINITTSKFLVEEIKKDKRDVNIFEKLKLKKIGKINEEKNENKKNDIIEEKRNIINEENKDKGRNTELKEEENKTEEKDKEMEFSSTQLLNANELLSNNSKIDNISDNKIDNLIMEQKNFIAVVTLNDSEKYLNNQYKIHFNYSQFTKFKSMENYMQKLYFLLKFINIDYNKSTISFDYDSLNSLEEKDWMKEVEKYSLIYKNKISVEKNIINKDEEKSETLLNNNKIEFPGGKKGISVTVEIKQPIILLRSIDKNGKIYTKVIEVLEDKENLLCVNNEENGVNLLKNIYELSLYYKRKEIDDKNREDLADNILHLALKKNMGDKN